VNRPWFDPKTGTLLLDDYVSRPSYRKVMEDGVVTDAELAEQAERVVSLLRSLEGMLSPEARDVATDTLCELAVLFALERQNQISARR
jgi:hypothetical protein